MISRGTKYALTICIALSLLVTAVALSIAMSTWQINRSQREWCDALNVLTSQPVPAPANPAQNPSREAAYRLYEDFVQVKQEFGCR